MADGAIQSDVQTSEHQVHHVADKVVHILLRIALRILRRLYANLLSNLRHLDILVRDYFNFTLLDILFLLFRSRTGFPKLVNLF